MKMSSSGMSLRVVILRTDVSEDLRASVNKVTINKVTRNRELRRTLAVCRKYFFAACVG
jgi:hypothetical protein